MEFELDILKQKLVPFMQDYKILYPDELIKQTDYTETLKNGKIKSKYLVVDDIKGYCEAHDIDLNIYRYVYTMECTPDFFNPYTLEFNVELNNTPLIEYGNASNGENIVSLGDIQYKVGGIKAPEEVTDEDRMVNPTYPDYAGDGLYPILEVDPAPYEKLKGNERIRAVEWLRKYPNTPRYGKGAYVNKIRDYDDDTTNELVYKEDPIFKNKAPRDKWFKYRFAIIQNHFYMFAINNVLPDTEINDFVVMEPSEALKDAKLYYGRNDMSVKIFGDYLIVPYRMNDNNHIEYAGNNVSSDLSLKINSKYVRLTKGQSLESIIINKIKKEYKDNVDLFIEDDKLKYDVKTSFFRHIQIRHIIFTNEKYNMDMKLWELDSPKADDRGDIFFLYEGKSFDDWIQGWIKNPNCEDTHYKDEINTFNRLTKGKCKDLLPNIADAIDLPEDWIGLGEKALAKYIRHNDYDLFMTYHKISHAINVRIKFDENNVEIVDKTIQDLKYTKFAYYDENDTKFFKIFVYNFRRNPFDLYICDMLYTGRMFVEREHHYDIIYIPILDLYAWFKHQGIKGFDYPYPYDYNRIVGDHYNETSTKSFVYDDRDFEHFRSIWTIKYMSRLTIDNAFKQMKKYLTKTEKTLVDTNVLLDRLTEASKFKTMYMGGYNNIMTDSISINKSMVEIKQIDDLDKLYKSFRKDIEPLNYHTYFDKLLVDTPDNIPDSINNKGNTFKVKFYLFNEESSWDILKQLVEKEEDVWNFLETKPNKLYTYEQFMKLTLKDLVMDFLPHLWVDDDKLEISGITYNDFIGIIEPTGYINDNIETFEPTPVEIPKPKPKPKPEKPKEEPKKPKPVYNPFDPNPTKFLPVDPDDMKKDPDAYPSYTGNFDPIYPIEPNPPKDKPKVVPPKVVPIKPKKTNIKLDFYVITKYEYDHDLPNLKSYVYTTKSKSENYKNNYDKLLQERLLTFRTNGDKSPNYINTLYSKGFSITNYPEQDYNNWSTFDKYKLTEALIRFHRNADFSTGAHLYPSDKGFNNISTTEFTFFFLDDIYTKYNELKDGTDRLASLLFDDDSYNPLRYRLRKYSSVTAKPGYFDNEGASLDTIIRSFDDKLHKYTDEEVENGFIEEEKAEGIPSSTVYDTYAKKDVPNTAEYYKHVITERTQIILVVIDDKGGAAHV